MLRPKRLYYVEQASPLAQAGQTHPALLHKRGRLCYVRLECKPLLWPNKKAAWHFAKPLVRPSLAWKPA